mgnify:FL=1
MKKTVAIIIPTLNRADFIIRTIQYYISIECKHPIFIGDASNSSLEVVILKIVDNRIDVHYFHWKGLSDRKTMLRLAEESAKNFDFCAFHGDDDYFIPDSLSKCAAFLDKNSSYATAQGKAVLFALNQTGAYGTIKFLDVYWGRKELLGISALDRLLEITKEYWVPNFSVHRTHDFIEDMSYGVDTIMDRNLGECINSVTMAMRGRSKYIDCLYLVRNVHDGIDHPSRFVWLTSPQWRPSFDALSVILSQLLSKMDGIPMPKSSTLVKHALFDHFSMEKNQSMSIKLYIKLLLKDVYKVEIIEKLFLILHRYIEIIFSCDDELKLECIKLKKSKYYEEFQPILHSLIKRP